MYEFYIEENPPKRVSKKKNRRRTIAAVVVLILVLASASFILPPTHFPKDEIISIKEGSTLEQIAADFERAGLVRSAGLFKTFVIGFGGDRSIAAGEYLFKNPLSSMEIALRIARGEYGIKKISVTLPEGLTTKEMASILVDQLPEFNADEFIYLTRDFEGYLFPDTYFFFPTATAPDVVRMLRETFERKVDTKIKTQAEGSGRGLEDIIIMASIVQDEAYDGYEEKRMIAGIFWKRIDKGMRLQADATLKYVTGRGSAQLTQKDLSSDNPYNTYAHEGLPPGPIGNPGLEAIRAAIDPKESEYFFYLHDANGKVHYAKTYEEHKKNIAAYLK